MELVIKLNEMPRSRFESSEERFDDTRHALIPKLLPLNILNRFKRSFKVKVLKKKDEKPASILTRVPHPLSVSRRSNYQAQETVRSVGGGLRNEG